MTTTDFKDFGARERRLAAELLNAWNEKGLPEDFYEDEVVIMMNTNSGNVFLTNSDYQVAMMNGNKLESFYTSPYNGIEGFFEDLDPSDMVEDDIEWYKDLKKSQKGLNGITTRISNKLIKNKNMNGFSRAVVSPTEEMNGFSRMNYIIDGYTLNAGDDYEDELDGYTLNGRSMRKLKRFYRRNAPWSYIGTIAVGLVLVDVATGGKVRETFGMKKKKRR